MSEKHKEAMKGNKFGAYSDADKKKIKKKYLEQLPNHSAMHWTTCKAIGITGGTMKKFIKEDPEFAEKVKEISEQVIDKVEETAHKLATGYEENVYYKGEKVDTQTKYSEKMIAMVLQKHRGYVSKVQNIDETQQEKKKRIKQLSEDMDEGDLMQEYMDSINEESES